MRKLCVSTLVVLSMAIPLAAMGNGMEPGGTFTDDNGNTHEGSIEAIAQENITRGCNPPVNTLYCPDDSVTRAEMAAFLVRAFELGDDTHPGFADVPDDHTFASDIGKLATAGVTRGCNPPDNDRYCPEDPVSREQMAAFLVRALGLTANDHPGFGDVPSDDTFTEDIGRLATAEVTRGCNPPDNDEFCPNETVGRDQMASFLARAKDLSPMTPPEVSTFGPGTHDVDGDIPAGLYRNIGFSDGCYWERLSGFSGEFGDIITNEFTHVRQIVEIETTDAGFSSNSQCGTWTNQLVSPRQGDPSAPLESGVYRVGVEVSPGSWESTPAGSDSCYWERLSGFSGELDDVIANDITDSTSIVEIEASDVGFLADAGCGTWTKVG